MTHDEYLKTVQIANSSLLEFASKISDAYKPLYNATQIKNNNIDYSSIQTALLKFAETNSKMMLNILGCSDINESISANMERMAQVVSNNFGKAFSSGYYSKLGKAIIDIKIHDDFVSIPETLIPDDFQYEKISNDSETAINQCVNEASIAKRLSLTDALTIIVGIATLLMWLLAPFYNHAVEHILSKEEDVSPNFPMTEEQTQQIVEYLSELTDCQQSILTALEVSEESAPTHDSCFDDTLPRFATPDSAQIENNQSHPTSADESKSSE